MCHLEDLNAKLTRAFTAQQVLHLAWRVMTIEIDRADAVGWHASVAHPAITQTCSFGANGPPTSRPDAAELRQFCSEDWEYRTGPE